MHWWFNPAPLVGAAATAVSGTSSVALDGVSQAGAGQVPVTGSSSVTLDGVVSAAAGRVAVQGASAKALDGVSQGATGTVGAAPIAGSSSVTLQGVAPSAAGQVRASGAGAAQLAGVSQTGAGLVPVRGASGVTLDGVTQSSAGRVVVQGSSVITLAGVSNSGVGQVPVRGASAAALSGVTQDAAGSVGLSDLEGTSQIQLEGVIQVAFGRVSTPAEQPFNWTPALDLAASSIIGQALRFMQLAPVHRHDPTSELLPALTAAFHAAIDELLSDADWSFASVLAVLPRSFPSLLAEADMPTLCMLPGDLVRLRDVRPCGARWRVDGSALRTDAEAPVTIRYTARITWEPALPATFKTAVALRIAMLLGARWAGGAIEPADIAEQAQRTLKQAMREDSRHAAGRRAVPLPDLGYASFDGDWAMEAVA